MIKKKILCMVLSISIVFSLLILPDTFQTEVQAAEIVKIGDNTSVAEDGNILTFTCGEQEVKVELCTPQTAHIELSLDGVDGYRPSDPQYYMVQKNIWDPVSRTVTDEGGYIRILTSKMDIHVQKSPLRIAMYDLDGNLLSKDADDQGMYWDDTGIRGVKKTEGTKNAGGIFGFGSGDHGRRADLNRYSTDFSEFTMSHGRVVAPFFMSTVGYGIFLNTIETNTKFFKQGGGFQTQGYLDYYFMYGPDFKTILNEYAEITGRMELYGKWANGFMLSKYGNDNATQAEFLEWLHKLRDEGYPSDAYVFDYGWRGDVADNGGNQTGAGQKFGKQMWSNDTAKFPDIPAMFDEARQLGFHVGLHNNAGTPEASGGKTLYLPENEQKWVKSYMDSVITTGFGDFFWPDEFDVLGSNTAPTLSSKGAYEAWQAYTDESRPMFMARGGYAGQHFATAWSGDINPTSAEIGNQIGFSIDTGLIGYWATSHDLGGFMSRPTDALYTRWVSEFGAWNGIMRTHGHDGREPWTFNQTAQDTLKKNLKTRYELYPYIYSLSWQGYSQGTPIMRAMLLEDGSQNNPAAWNLNKQYYFGDWFLVAPAQDTSDTVVSVWLPPQTTWYNYYTGKRYEGGASGKTINVAAALTDIPVFVKAGAIVPMGPDVDYADEKPLDPLTLDIYPKGTTDFTLYEDDGVSRKYITENAYSTTKYESVQNANDISFKIFAREDHNAAVYKPADRSYNLKFNHIAQINGVTVNGNSIFGVSTLEQYNASQEAYWLDSTNNIVYVKTPDTGEEINVELASGGIVEPALGNENEGIPAKQVNDGDTFELETGKFLPQSGGQVIADTEWKGYTGTGFAKGFKVAGDAVQFDADIVKAGTYNLKIRVNCGKKNDPQYDSSPRTGGLYLNGTKAADLSFAVTDVWGNTVNSVKQGVWVDYTIPDIKLDAGVNTFKIQAEGPNPGNYNLDSLTFNRLDTTVNAFSRIEAESAGTLTNVSKAALGDGTNVLSTSTNGAWAQFNEVRGSNKGGLQLRVKSTTGGRIIAYENGVGDKVLATFDLPEDGQWTTLTEKSKDTDADTSNIFFEFVANSASDLDCDMDWFRFIPRIDSGDTFEAEDAQGDTTSAAGDGSGTVRVDNQWPGYTGTGYVAGWKSVGHYVEFQADVAQTGNYDVTLNVANGKKNASQYDDTPRTGVLYIDGVKAADFGLEVHETWGEWFEHVIEGIPIEEGIHTFKIRSEGSENSGNFNLDSIRFDLQASSANSITVTPVSGATVTADKSQAQADEVVSVTIKDIVQGKAFKSISVTDADGEPVDTAEVTVGKKYTFVMPASSVTVDVELQDVTPDTLNIRSVQQSDPLTVEYGTDYDSLELPETVDVTLSDDTDISLSVNWIEGGYSGNRAGTYTLKGSLILEDGITNTNNIQASIQITVEDNSSPGTDKIIHSFNPLNPSVKNQTVAYGTPFSSLNLPQKLKAEVDGIKDTWVSITKWVSDITYNPLASKTYRFAPVLDSGYVLEDNAGLPSISVTVKPKKSNHSSGSSSSSSTGNTPKTQSTMSTTTTAGGGTAAEVTTKPDTAPAVSGSKSSVTVSIPTEITSVISNATAEKPAQVTIALPTETILEQLSSSTVQTVTVNMQVPSSVANNTNANANISITASQAALQAAKDAKKDITLTVTDSDMGSEAYSWTFSGAGLSSSVAPVTNVNLALNVVAVRNDTSAAEVVAKNAADQNSLGTLIQFNNHGLLPGLAKVRVYVGNQQGCAPNSQVFLYYLNRTTKVLEQLPRSEYTVDANGYVEIDIIHCSDYVLLPKAAANPYPAKSDTTYPVGVKYGESYTFMMTAGGNSTPSFGVGNGQAFTSMVKRQGNKYYFTVKAVGSVGTMTAVYSTLPGQQPVILCYISVVK